MVHPRDASTVVLVRPGGDGSFEILLTRRPQEMRFLGGYYVFPGGTVHRDDYSPLVLARCRGLSGEDARTILGSQHEPEEALGHWVAVVRELFEEVGVLLCVDGAGDSDRFQQSTKRATDLNVSVKRSCGNSSTSARFFSRKTSFAICLAASISTIG